MQRDAGRSGPRRGLDPLLVLLVAGVVLPYAPVIAGVALPVADDGFVSDGVDLELPIRVACGRATVEQGLSPWLSGNLLGFPCPVDPWDWPYLVLPPVPALGVHWALMLAVAAASAWTLARTQGASRPAAFLAGATFAWSGATIAQLRHTAVLGTICWFPLALALVERTFGVDGGDDDPRRAAAVDARTRARAALGFAGVFGAQLLAGFPQSAYYSGLVAAALVLARTAWLARVDRRAALLSAALVAGATLVAVAVSAPVVLSIADAARSTHRLDVAGTWAWVAQQPTWIPNLLGLAWPYPFGDVGAGTYVGRDVFWESHGFVGPVVVGLAGLALARGATRRFTGAFWAVVGLLALVFVLGPNTPLFRACWSLVPGMRLFRFPTRMLFVVELALALLAAHGLDRLRPRWPRLALALPPLSLALLVAVNARQNPLADPARWFPTPFEDTIRAEGGRTWHPEVRRAHVAAHEAARGWADLEPYYAHRALLQPDSNLLAGIASIDGYVPWAPAWGEDLVGQAGHVGVITRLLEVAPARVPSLLRVLGVRWVLAPPGWDALPLARVDAAPGGVLWRLDGGARARVIFETAPTPDDLVGALAGGLDLERVAFTDPAVDLEAGGTGEARVVRDDGREVELEATLDRRGLVVLADGWQPAWTATLDGREVPLVRVDHALRGVVAPAGRHTIVLRWTSPLARTGVGLGAAGLVALAAGAVLLRRRRPFQATAPHGDTGPTPARSPEDDR